MGICFFLPNMAKLAQKGAKRLPFHRGEGIRLIDRALFKMELLRVSPLFVISMTILRWYDQSGKQAISLASTSALSVSLAYWMIISIFSVRFHCSCYPSTFMFRIRTCQKELKSKPSDREEIVRPATPNSFHNRRRQVQLGTSALQRAVDLLSGGGGGGDGEEALVTFFLRLG